MKIIKKTTLSIIILAILFSTTAFASPKATFAAEMFKTSTYMSASAKKTDTIDVDIYPKSGMAKSSDNYKLFVVRKDSEDRSSISGYWYP